MKFSIACIQLTSGTDMMANIATVADLAARAAGQGAQLVALPENVFLMRDPADKASHELFTYEQHPGVKAASEMARQNKVWLLVGSVAVAAQDGKCLNRSLLFNPTGERAAHYDKIHLFDVTLAGGEVYAESSRFLPGDKAVLTQMGDIKLGMTVCYDVRFPHLYRALAKAGTQIIAVPSAFTQTTGEAHWHVLLRARAIENGCYIIAPAQVGTHPGGRKTYGHALIVDPWGRVLADAGTDEGFIMAEVDVDLSHQTRTSLPSLSHDVTFSFE